MRCFNYFISPDNVTITFQPFSPAPLRLQFQTGRAGVPMEVMGLMLGEFVDECVCSRFHIQCFLALFQHSSHHHSHFTPPRHTHTHVHTYGLCLTALGCMRAPVTQSFVSTCLPCRRAVPQCRSSQSIPCFRQKCLKCSKPSIGATLFFLCAMASVFVCV